MLPDGLRINVMQGNVRTKSVAGGGVAIEALLNHNKHRKPSRKRVRAISHNLLADWTTLTLVES